MRLRGRFAPSPTGELHLGNARTALLAWLQVRAAGGQFVLRVEDLDPTRSRREYLEGQLEDLRWLGLDWDEGPDVGGPFGPYLQSRRHELYRSALRSLASQGSLFSCFCSRKEIAAAAAAPHAADEEGPAYPGTCRDLTPTDRTGSRQAALRFKVPEGQVAFRDGIFGERRYLPAVETGDFVVRRKDGVAAYQLAVVVDDAAMQISDVLRASDLLSSTARQILLYRALGLPEPRWTHVPLLLAADGERLSKRSGALSLRELRERGTRPEILTGWLASTCGLATPGEVISPNDLIRRFGPARLPNDDTRVAIPDWLRRDGADNRNP
ncbi:MAG: tRNA glutamyl-Q(34) synthetase GluQRS [Gemmatimonas sp.]|nr:tRNA glutamyl-Q(34) synthetase GluQRS [Gemmatimonas sp.]